MMMLLPALVLFILVTNKDWTSYLSDLSSNFIAEAKIAVLSPLAFHVYANVMPLATLHAWPVDS